MGVTEQELYQDFGLEAPEESAAEPSELVETASGEPETAVSDPEQQTDVETPTTAPEAAESVPERKNEDQGNTEQAAEQAGVRQAAVDEAYRKAFSGKLNPYTHKPILSQADYEEYQRQLSAEQNKAQMEQLSKAGIDPAALQSVVENMPIMQQARQAVEQAKQARAAADAEKAKGWFKEQIEGINALGLDGDVTTLDQLAAQYPDKYPKMLERVRRGATLVEAYKLENFDAIMGRRTAAAKQATLNGTAGKQHLVPTGISGQDGGVEVPSNVKQMYRELNPGMSDAEIRKEYAAYLKMSG